MKQFWDDCEVFEEVASYIDDGVEIQGRLLSMKVFLANDMSAGWDYQAINKDNIQHLITKKTTTIEKNNNIASLGEDWDGKGAKPIDKVVVDNTISLISGLSVIPTAITPNSRGCISLLYVYKNRRLSVDVHKDMIELIENGKSSVLVGVPSEAINQYLETFF